MVCGFVYYVCSSTENRSKSIEKRQEVEHEVTAAGKKIAVDQNPSEPCPLVI